MAITSHAFGRVALTADDAKKFERQVKYGNPNEKAKKSVANGMKIVKSFNETGKVTFKLARKMPGKA